MSWLQPASPIQFAHPSKLYRAITVALLASIAGISQAATLGSTAVESTQHEPLSASITVTDIDPNSFSASLADPNIYSKMGLQPTDTMSVRFVPTGPTSGRIVLSTAKPVSTPFADVVLAISDKGQQQVVPKTLLMPLDKSAAKANVAPTVVNKTKPNLPEVSAPVTQPLVVKRTAPPPLLMTSDSANGAQSANNAPTSVNLPSSPVLADIDGQSNNVNAAAPSLPSTAPASINKQLDILNVEVIRKVQPAGQNNAPAQSSVLVQSNTPLSAVADRTAPSSIANTTKTPETKPKSSASSRQPATKANTSRANSSAAPTTSSKAVYTVQRNDNLWTIADEIARKNNLDVATVMSQIHDQNPDAFIEQDANLLKANAKLQLPDYKVIPSQQSLQAAIKARRSQQSRTSNTKVQGSSKVAASASSSNKAATSTKPAATRDKSANTKAKVTAPTPAAKRETPTQTVTKSLPKARMTVIAPGKDGSADGTQTKASAATGSGINTDIMATLKSSRLKTAAQASRVREVNSQLSNYTKTLQLQNQKLAELEARLKELRKK